MDEKRYQAAKQAMFTRLYELGYIKGENLVFVCLQGSQNYNLDLYTDEYSSDFDWKAFVLPDFNDLYYNVKISTKYEYEYGQIELKDIRLIIDLLSKMNSSYLELLYSNYCSGRGYISYLRSAADSLYRERKPLLIKTLMGMALEKQKALCHPYEGLKDKIEKFGGYDPKQLHHALRCKYMMQRIAEGVDHYNDVLVFATDSPEYNELMTIKEKGCGSQAEAVAFMDKIINSCREYYHRFWDENKQPVTPISSSTLDKMQNFIYELIRDNMLG